MACGCKKGGQDQRAAERAAQVQKRRELINAQRQALAQKQAEKSGNRSGR